MKYTLLFASLFVLLLIACPQPEEAPKAADKPIDTPEPDTKTAAVVFDNTQGVCTVTVYDDYRREEAHKIARIAAGASSAASYWQPSASYPFYFSYTITLNGVEGFSIEYVPETGRDQTALRLDANSTTTVTIPKLDDTLSTPDAPLSGKSFVVVQNASAYSFQMQRNSSSIPPDAASSAVVNAGERAFYTLNPGGTSPYGLLVGADVKPFTGALTAFEVAYYYLFSFNGSAISLVSQIPVTVANMQPPAPDYTLPVPAAPSLTAGDREIIAQWAETEGAEGYEVYIGTGAEPPAAPVRTVSGTSTLLSSLVNKTLYSVWIKAVNSAGSSDFSPPAQARPWPATEAPETPSCPQVVGGVYQLTVSWNAASGADSYEVYYSTVNTQPSSSALLTTGTRGILTGLTNSVTYYIWVRAVNAAGRSGYSLVEIGTPRAPTTPPAAPGTPFLIVGSRELLVSWEPVAITTAYEVWAGTSANSADAVQYGEEIAGGDTQTMLTGLVNGTTYHVWIKAKNDAGTSGFSPPASIEPSAFAGLPFAPTAAPQLTLGSRELSLSWQAGEGAELYEVWFGPTNNTANAIRYGSALSAATLTLGNLVNGTTYYIWIKSKNSHGTSDFGPVASGTPTAFAALPAAPGTPTITTGSRQLVVNWQAAEGAQAYEVWAGTSSNSANAEKQGDDSSGLSKTITGLTNGTTYYVWVKAKNAVGTSGFSPAASAVPFTKAELYKGAEYATAAEISNYDFGTALSYISGNAVTGDNYYIVLLETIQCAPTVFDYSGKTVGITLMANGVERTVQLSSNGALFTINSGVTLTLEDNVTLKGRASNTTSLVMVEASGTFTMNGGKISGNTASSGGGVLVNGGTYAMNGGEISGNTVSSSSASYGGGVYVDNSGTLTMSGGKISGNTASSSASPSYSHGGGVYVGNGTFTMSAGEISSNRTFTTSASLTYSHGGGVYVGNSNTFTMTGGKISGNTASGPYNVAGGGVYVYQNVTFTMSGGEISGNTTNGQGGGVNVSGSTFTMSGGKISDNTTNGQGGGVYVFNNGTFTMSAGEISGNSASTSISSYPSYGGGVYVIGSSSTFIMSGGKISGNSASGSSSSSSYGGGVGVSTNGTFTMNEGEISGNTASSSYSDGGGVYCSNSGTFTMNDGKISGNTASGSSRSQGGGVYVGIGTFTMNDGEISGNTASGSSNSSGGGVNVVNSLGTFTMNGGEISGNTASLYGGGVYVYNIGTFIKSSTGGLITGYGNDTVNGNKVVSAGVVQSGRGHAVYSNSNPVKKLERTVITSKALDSRVTGSGGGWTE